MAIKAVNDWLNGERNYTEGAALYKRYGSSKVLADLFAKSQNTYTQRKLLQELEQLNQQHVPEPAPVAVPCGRRKRDIMRLSSFQTKEQNTFKPVDLTNAPLALQNLDKRRRSLFQQAAEIKAALDAGQFTTQHERYMAVKTIDENFYGHRGIQQIWQRIDFWNKHGRFVLFTAAKASAPVNTTELHKRLTTVRTYLSKYKGKPDKATLYDKYLLEQQELEQQLMDNGSE